MSRPLRAPVVPGLEVLIEQRLDLLRGRRIGLLANPASVDRELVHSADRLAAVPDCELVALFGPEHGVRGEAQDMEALASGIDPGTGLPVHSLYGVDEASLTPEPGMLAGLDLLVCDLTDVGARYYTFATTVFHVMEAAARSHLPVVVTDRPNPLGGEVLEGPVLQPSYASFVGRVEVPARHGLTIGELALLFRRRSGVDAELEVVPVRGWRRSMSWESTGLPWVAPSPNMPTPDTAAVYPGGCLVEGTNLSEGRGTTRPFEWVGAPWLDAPALARELTARGLPGVHFRPHWFRPVAGKWAGETCAGVQVHVLDRDAFRPFAAYVALLGAARAQAPERLAWRTEAYEFVDDRPAIDLLAGDDRLRRDLEAGRPLEEMETEWRRQCEAFRTRRRRWLIYPEGE